MSSARLAIFDANCDAKAERECDTPPPTKLEEIFEQLIAKKLFDRAWEISKVFELKPYPLIKALALECMNLDMNPQKGEADWVAKGRKHLTMVVR
ncbi:unnamed protein product [Gongylonema pulchrum]|uniref:Uncharacterized protein n=1 Tax=Gongylonema pulchrum TaxID=637853 RepID=A0A3P6RRL9_9BILA|nr:unnamed protein product [Gongylonema pulchrum]